MSRSHVIRDASRFCKTSRCTDIGHRYRFYRIAVDALYIVFYMECLGRLQNTETCTAIVYLLDRGIFDTVYRYSIGIRYDLLQPLSYIFYGISLVTSEILVIFQYFVILFPNAERSNS